MITVGERAAEGWLVQPSPDTTLEAVGHTPIPPYILKARDQHSIVDEVDRRWYRTVYADAAEAGSVAADRGVALHPELLDRLQARGVERATVTLHVGPGTFAPISAERLEDHVMHEEAWSISSKARRIGCEKAVRGPPVGSSPSAPRPFGSSNPSPIHCPTRRWPTALTS